MLGKLLSFIFPRLFDSKIWQGRQNFVLSVQRIILKKQRSFKKFSKFSLVIGRWSTFSGLLGMIFQQFCQSSISDVLRNSLRRLTSEEVFNVFGIIRYWTKNFRTSSKVFRQSGQNCILHIRRNSSRKNAFFEKKNVFFVTFGFLLKFLLTYGKSCFREVAKASLYVSRGINYEWSFFYPDRTLSKQNSAFRETVETGFSKLLFTCPEQHFRKTLLLWKKIFLSNLGISAKVSGL